MNTSTNYEEIAKAAKIASRSQRTLSTQSKNQVLLRLAEQLGHQSAQILAANKKDVDAAKANQVSTALIDRIMLNQQRIEAMIEALHTIIQLEDSVGAITQTQFRPNGLQVSKQRVPLGVILMIVEARPNVAIEAAALCFKSGNVCLLKGGKEALYSNQILGQIWQQVLEEHQLNPASVQILASDNREAIYQLLQQKQSIDLVIPRGGTALINFVSEHSKIPVIQHYQGICHLYVSNQADITKAFRLFKDGKTSRPAVCNALETLLIHKDIAAEFIQQIKQQLPQLELRGCEQCQAIDASIVLAKNEDYATEYLDLIVSIKVVDSIEQAIAHIDKYGSQHSEVIATDSIAEAEQFINQIDASVVLINASSRFSDGGELGLGAEIGISTTKLHAYGPMGLQALTTERYVVKGAGQVRH